MTSDLAEPYSFRGHQVMARLSRTFASGCDDAPPSERAWARCTRGGLVSRPDGDAGPTMAGGGAARAVVVSARGRRCGGSVGGRAAVGGLARAARAGRIRFLRIIDPASVKGEPSLMKRLWRVLVGSGDAPHMSQPYGVAVGPDGKVFVADHVRGVIHVYDLAKSSTR